MGRTLQKAKNRSSIPRATLKPKSKKRPVKSSSLVAAHWDKHLTLSQNYRKLGLTSKLNARTGGTEVKAKDVDQSKESPLGQDPLAIAGSRNVLKTGLKTAKVVRDEEGRILEVVHEQVDRNPLNDPLTALEQESDLEDSRLSNQERNNGIIPALEAAAEAELAEVKRRKKPRKQSEREREWIKSIVEKYGDDVGAMSRDRRLNPNQQTEADIRRRIMIWRQGKGHNERI